MDDNKCCNICGTLTIDGDMSATMSVGTIVARDGTAYKVTVADDGTLTTAAV